MFGHLLVPLDGSHLAEAVLPAVSYLAQQLQAKVTLLHVIEHNPPQAVHGDFHIANVQEAQHYLAELASTLPSALQVTTHTHPNKEDDIARSIVEHAHEFDVDLIVLCTHGRSDLHRWLFGTIAQKAIALGSTPVLLIHPPADRPLPGFICRHILAPLDGNLDHEAGLVAAVELAQRCNAALQLVAVVPTLATLNGQSSAAARLMPVTATTLLDLSEQQVLSYLRDHVAQLSSQGLVVGAEVQRGEPAPTIVRAAEKARADLIVMATHGKTHLDAFWSGSVTPRVSGRSHLPLLLVPAVESEPAVVKEKDR
jgi:nucleotide-binding universal stress UspA family protein